MTIRINENACGPVCPNCKSDEYTYLCDAETKTPNGEPIDPNSPEAEDHYWCNGCGWLMVMSTGEWMQL